MMQRTTRFKRCAPILFPLTEFLLTLLVAASTGSGGVWAVEVADPASVELTRVNDFINDHCLDCHTGNDAEQGFRLEDFAETWRKGRPSKQTVMAWETTLLRLASRQMPPPDSGQPDGDEYEVAIDAISTLLDRHCEKSPYAGQTEPLRRMTRTEYRNSIRDLLAYDVDVETLLPPDSSSDGFDNITVSELSPLLIDRYLTAATRISRSVIGSSVNKPAGVTVRIPADQSQEQHVKGLPMGTRGGTVVRYHFPRAGEYEVQIRLMRDRDERVEGMRDEHQMVVLLDRKRMHDFDLSPPRGNKDHATYDAGLNVRLTVSAGAHDLGVTFVENATPLIEIKRKPFEASFNRHRHPRLTPAVSEVSIVGPFGASEADRQDRSASRKKIFVARPSRKLSAQNAARQVFAHLIRRAYRRSVEADDLVVPMEYFSRAFSAEVLSERTSSKTEKSAKSTEENGGSVDDSLQQRFDLGVEAGLASILVNPNFLFRTARQPDGMEKGTVYPLPADEVASRLSYFLWSSLPDELLLDAAEADALDRIEQVASQTRRMLKDPRSQSLIDSFADQWLYLRNLPTITPDLRKFADFDNNLREAFAEETKQFFADMIRRDASVLELISSGHTFLNQRLATHYGIPGVVGSHFRRVDLRPEWHRGGLLRQGSVLMATSYATRTSPTIRGAWVLENILGTPPPPPPPNVPTIKEKSGGIPLSFREALAKHRDDATCASCHDLIDPVGFALDRYDAVGRWRDIEEGEPIDARGRLPDGQEIEGVMQLEQGILGRPELFVTALTEKLMTYALGRPITHADGPAVRKIVRAAKANDYRFSSLMTGITTSTPFLMRTSR